jgi:DNA polymerase type B, organellar and viral
VQQVAFSCADSSELTSRSFDQKSHKTKSLKSQAIIGIDGEGYNDEERDHHYDLVACAGSDWTDHKWADNKELTFNQIAEFLLGLADKHGKALYFIYGGSYDFNMWVKRLSDKALGRLNKRGRCRAGYYTVQYRPRREIIIGDRRTLSFRRDSRGRCHHSYARSIHIYDVIGFFQSSFVKALEDWKITDEQSLELIRSMKLKRGQFSQVNKEKILLYCLEECKLLVQLGERLRDAAVRANVKPTKWYGAGALATTLMMRHHVKEYLAPIDPSINRYFLHAYFGGRTDISYVGFMGTGYHYDISSAYPTAMVNHPCLKCGKWEVDYDGNNFSNGDSERQYSIWYVEWNCHGVLWGPFPYRLSTGSITYPCCGKGYYHRIEIEAAIRLYPHGIFTIFDGVYYRTNCSHRPFSFIPEAAAYRLELKAKGDAAHKPLKLGLNSLYGKTAQTLGGTKNHKPPYQSFYWAGLTTAITRAKMLDAIRTCKGTILSIATDGLISNGPIPVDIGPHLGQWERTTISSGLLVKPGVYKWIDELGKFHYGTRGFTSDEANWNEIENQWRNHRFAGAWTFKAERFIGIRQALHRGANWRNWFGKWVIGPRELKFMPEINRRDIRVPIDRIPDFGSQDIPEFCELVSICHCSSGMSAAYRKIEPEEDEHLMQTILDEEQP